MFDLGEFLFTRIKKLIINIIDNKLEATSLSFLEKRKIKGRVEDSTAEVVGILLPFLKAEHISQEKQERLIDTCIRELTPIAENSSELFKGSLNGQKIFENLYNNQGFPEVIVEEGLNDIYSLLFPRIATLICKMPEAVNDWEKEAWAENFNRFDEIVRQLESVILQVENIAISSDREADSVFTQYKKMLTQKIGIQLDITGLRADQPYSGKFDDYFVLPCIRQEEKEKKERKETPIFLEVNEDYINEFLNFGILSIIKGVPGSGKSTWTKWLQREILKRNIGKIAVRVEFRKLNVSKLPSAYEIIRNSVSLQLTEDLSASRIKKWITSFRIVFILDGFDEIKPDNRDKFIEWIIELESFTAGCPIIITSRPLTTDHLHSVKGDWRYWYIESFNEERIIKYITQWYANFPILTDCDRNIDSKNLAMEWRKDPIIGPLTGNPLLLSTLLLVHHLDGKLPNGRANLYKRYVDGMLGLWEERNKVTATDIKLTPEEKRKVLRGIAIKLFFSDIEAIEEDELNIWLEDFLQENNIKESATDVLSVLRERTGLIIGPGIYTFAHKTIIEFLVAETVLEGVHNDLNGNRIDRYRLLNHIDDDRWNVVIFLWAGLSPAIDVTSFIEYSIDKKNLGLGFGILLDQYDRIAVLDKIKMFTKLSDLAFFIPEGFIIFTPRGCPEKWYPQFGFPLYNLRSISGDIFHNNLANLLQKAIIDNSISWKDFSLVKDDFGWLLVFLFSSTPSHDWETVIKKYKTWIESNTEEINNKINNGKSYYVFPSGYSSFNIVNPSPMTENDWGYFIAERMFGEWRLIQKPDLVPFFYKFKKLFPKFNGFVSLLLITEIVLTDKEFQQEITQNYFIDHFEKVAKIIIDDNFEKLDKQFLKETTNWVIFKNNINYKGDILMMFNIKLQELSKIDTFKDNEALAKLFEIIDNMRQVRKNL